MNTKDSQKNEFTGFAQPLYAYTWRECGSFCSIGSLGSLPEYFYIQVCVIIMTQSKP